MSLDNLDGQVTPGDLLDLGLVTRGTNGRLSNGGSSPAGLYLPTGWNANFLSRLSGSGSQLARIAVVGDSVSQGYYSSNLDLKSWPAVLALALQGAYGDGGFGFKGVSASTTSSAARGLGSTQQTAYAATGSFWTLAGTWTSGSTPGGPAYAWPLSTVDTTPATATFTVRGTTVRIYTVSNGGANAAWQYKIDGGTAVSVADAAGHNIQVTTISGLAAGTHSVQVIYNDAGTKTLFLCGIRGENAAGVIVDNFSIYGAQSASLDASSTAFTDGSITPDWLGGYQLQADLAIWALGLNDAANNIALDTYATNFRRWLQQVRDGNTLEGTTDVLAVIPHVGKFDNTNYVYQSYADRIRGIAEAYGAAVIDFWAIGRGSWNKWHTLGYWGNSTSIGNAGTETVHLSDAGNAYMAGVVQSLILKAV